MNGFRAALGAMLLAWSAESPAQKIVRDVTAAGGKPLTQSEMLAVLPGIYAGSDGERRWNYTLEKEGRLIGVYSHRYTSPVTGTWTVERSGQVCVDVRGSPSRPVVSVQQCHFIFKLGDAYFASAENTPEASLQSVTLAH